MTRTRTRTGASARGSRATRSERALQAVTGTLAVGVVGLALSLGAAVAAGAPSLPAQVQPGPLQADMATTPVSRPMSPDAAERWWLSCTAQTPGSPDGAERWVLECW